MYTNMFVHTQYICMFIHLYVAMFVHTYYLFSVFVHACMVIVHVFIHMYVCTCSRSLFWACFVLEMVFFWYCQCLVQSRLVNPQCDLMSHFIRYMFIIYVCTRILCMPVPGMVSWYLTWPRTHIHTYVRTHTTDTTVK